MLAIFGLDGRLHLDGLRASSRGVAILADDLQLRDFPDARDAFIELRAVVEVGVHSSSGEIFVGIGRADDVAGYLEGAPIDRVQDLDPIQIDLRQVPGTGSVARPGSQDFWAESVEGAGAQTLSWRLERGTWSLVVMNADGSRGIDVTADAAIDVPLLGRTALVLLVAGLALLAGGLAFVISGTRTPRKRNASQPPAPPGAPAHAPPAAATPPRPDAFG